MTDALNLLAKYIPGSDFDDPVSLLQRNLLIGYARALTLTDTLEKRGVWSPLIDGKRFLARNLWLHLPDTISTDPRLSRIEFIDAISRKLQRDVLYLVFAEFEAGKVAPVPNHDLSIHKQLTDWLDSQGFAWQPCLPFADPAHPRGYTGSVYVDVPPDAGNSQYERLRHHMEDATGQSRFHGVRLSRLAYAAAKGNFHNDEPGFYDVCLAYLFSSDRER